MRMSFPTCGPMRVPALCVWTIALLGVFAVPVHGQGELADRIAEQRDRAEVDAATPAESAETPAADAAIETDIAETDIAETELAPIPAPVFAEDQLPLGPTPADGEVGSAGDKAPLLGRNWMMNTLAALGVVIGLIFLLRWIAKRSGMGGGVRVSASSPIVEVLSRTTVAPRSHIVLLRVGSRILVVNDGAADCDVGMSGSIPPGPYVPYSWLRRSATKLRTEFLALFADPLRWGCAS